MTTKERLNENLMDVLYYLTQEEQERTLTDDEKNIYLSIVEIFEKENIEIPFGYIV